MIRRLLRSSVSGVIIATLLLVVALLFRPVTAEVAFDAFVLVLGGIALVALVSATIETEPGPRRSVYDQALEPRTPEPERPLELTRMEREVALGIDSAFYAHYRLRPLLREVAEHRLQSRYAVELDHAAGEARESLPEDAWALFDPDRKPPRNPHGPGVPRERLAAIVDSLERIEP